MANQNPFAIHKEGFTGTAIDFSGVVYTTLPVYASDGVTVLTPGTPTDVSNWIFMLTVGNVYQNDWQIGAGLGTSGAWGTTWAAIATLTTTPETYPWEVKVIVGGAGDPIMLCKGDVAIRQSVGARIVPNLA
jgi:hypothetical protein